MSMKEFFCPRPRSASACLREIMGKNRSPTYWSPKPTNEIQQYIDNVLARHCLERDDWHACDTAWLCTLAQSSSLMLTHEAFKGQCYFSLGEFSSSTVAGCPKTQHQGCDVLFPPAECFIRRCSHNGCERAGRVVKLVVRVAFPCSFEVASRGGGRKAWTCSVPVEGASTSFGDGGQGLLLEVVEDRCRADRKTLGLGGWHCTYRGQGHEFEHS